MYLQWDWETELNNTKELTRNGTELNQYKRKEAMAELRIEQHSSNIGNTTEPNKTIELSGKKNRT